MFINDSVCVYSLQTATRSTEPGIQMSAPVYCTVRYQFADLRRTVLNW